MLPRPWHTRLRVPFTVSCNSSHCSTIFQPLKRQYGRSYTPDEDELILKRLKEGSNVHSIAAKLGRAYGSVRNRCVRGLRAGQLLRGCRYFTKEEDDVIIQRRKDNVPFTGIAQELGRSTSVINQRWNRMLRHTVNDSHVASGSRGPKLKSLNGLGPKQVAALILERRREGYSGKAIAAELGCSTSTVRFRYAMVCPAHERPTRLVGKQYTEFERQAIRHLQLEGLNVRAIASRINCGYGSLRDLLAKERNSFKPAKHYRLFTPEEDRRLLDLRKQGATWTNIAEVLNRSHASVRNRGILLSESSSSAGQRWTAAEDEVLISLYRQRLSLAEMAKTLDRGQSSVRSRLQVQLPKRGDTDWSPGLQKPGRQPRQTQSKPDHAGNSSEKQTTSYPLPLIPP